MITPELNINRREVKQHNDKRNERLRCFCAREYFGEGPTLLFEIRPSETGEQNIPNSHSTGD